MWTWTVPQAWWVGGIPVSLTPTNNLTGKVNNVAGTKADLDEALKNEGEAMAETDAALAAQAAAVDEAVADAADAVEEVIEAEADKLEDAADAAADVIVAAVEAEATEVIAETGTEAPPEVIADEIAAQVEPNVSGAHDTPATTDTVVIVTDDAPVEVVAEGGEVADVTPDAAPEETHWYFKKRNWFGRKG